VLVTGRQVLRGIFGVVYGLMAVVGLWGVLGGGPTVAGDPVLLLSAVGILGLGAGGLGLLLVEPWVDRHPRSPVLGAAPSGAPALCFLRSPVRHLVSALVLLWFALWSAALAVIVLGRGQPGWAALWGLGAVGLLWMLATLVTGRRRPGGVWLTRAGVEYRKDAVGWAVPWTQVETVLSDRAEWKKPPLTPVLVRVQGIVLVVRGGATVPVQRSMRWSRDEQHGLPERYLAVSCFGLAGGQQVVVETIERYLAHPAARDQLGTEWSLPRRAG
jgi:hypothetical protein